MKPGYKTTEFWLTAIAVLAATAVNVLPTESAAAQVATAIVAGLAAIGYTASRAKVKSAAS